MGMTLTVLVLGERPLRGAFGAGEEVAAGFDERPFLLEDDFGFGLSSDAVFSSATGCVAWVESTFGCSPPEAAGLLRLRAGGFGLLSGADSADAAGVALTGTFEGVSEGLRFGRRPPLLDFGRGESPDGDCPWGAVPGLVLLGSWGMRLPISLCRATTAFYAVLAGDTAGIQSSGAYPYQGGPCGPP